MSSKVSNRGWALFFARWILGLIFFMAGVWKVFQLGPIGHARRFFVGPYEESFLPVWLLWSAGTVIPVVELTAGALLLAGWRVREALLALVGVLVVVTFGHLLAEPLYQFHTHVIPRAALVLFLLWMPREEDVLTVDYWRTRR
ncbi:MAG: DoxX family membrane protein [Gemmatimonadetes bacterium]|nr:DoxX family membrane protein [Gemmatimonadota bacterium]MCH7489582.1 DoxX family membrane protein [Gemmatimonadota bacterium]